MKTVQMTLDDDLIAELDIIVKEKKTNRSAFTREALKQAIIYYRELQRVNQHHKGYMKQPVNNDEFSVWEDEQAWGDE